MLLHKGDPVFQPFLLCQPAVSPTWGSRQHPQPVEARDRQTMCTTGVFRSSSSPAPSELQLLCPSLGGCQVPCRDLFLMQWSLSDKINEGHLIHTEAGQPSRAAWQALIRSTMIALPGRVAWCLAQHMQCKWLVATACWRAAPKCSLLTRVGRNLCETNWDGVWGLLSFKHTLLSCSLPQSCVCSHFFPPTYAQSHLCTPYFCWSYEHTLFSLSPLCCSQVPPLHLHHVWALFVSLRIKCDGRNACRQMGLWGILPSCPALLQGSDGEAGWCDHPGTAVGGRRRWVQREA